MGLDLKVTWVVTKALLWISDWLPTQK